MNTCTLCGEEVHYDTSIQLLSFPPQYRGWCTKCGCVHYVYVDEYLEENNDESVAKE